MISENTMTTLEEIVTSFERNLRGVDKLINFDRDVLALVKADLEGLHERLKMQGIDNPSLNAEKSLNFVSQIQTNNSLRSRYQTVFNQAIVLLVSYFASTVGDLFRYGIAFRLTHDTNTKLLDEEIKMTFGETRERDGTFKDGAADLLIAKKDLSFQDMGSAHKAFDTYVRISLDQDKRVNNIITAQACRHAIVHAGAVVGQRTVKQLLKISPRDLKPQLSEDDLIQFTPHEIALASENMQSYVTDLADKLRAMKP